MIPQIIYLIISVVAIIVATVKIKKLEDKVIFYKYKASRIRLGLSTILKTFLERRRLKKDREILNLLQESLEKEMVEDDYEIAAIFDEMTHYIKEYLKKK